MNKTIDAIVAGHVCLDITPIFREDSSMPVNRIFVPGKLVNMSGVNISPAGTVPNVGISLKMLGIETNLMGKLGDDYFGEGVLNLLAGYGLKDGMIVSEGENTSYTVVIVPPGVDRMFLHDPGANNTFCADDIDYGMVKQAKLFHFGYPPLMKRMFQDNGSELEKIFRRVKEADTVTSLDMAFTEPSSESGRADWNTILKRVLPFVDIYIPSIEETLYMLDRECFNRLDREYDGSILEGMDMNKLQELGQTIISYGAGIAVIKCGTKGYYIRTGSCERIAKTASLTPIDPDNWSDRELLIETFDVDGIKSTTGAGDSSIAGFLSAVLKGVSIEDAVRIAHAVATQSIQAYDVFSNIKDFETTAKSSWNDMPLIRVDIEGSYWKYDEQERLWRGLKDSGICQE